jgi:chaperonin GroEL
MLVKDRQNPSVVFQPQLSKGMQRGINQLANAIRPTLGPFPRLVAVESSINRSKLPEILDSGGLIARRMLQLPERDADAGAMLLRHMLWELHEKAGDGTATAAVIFQSVYNQGARFIAAGGDAMRLRTYLEQGSVFVTDQLEGMKVFMRGKEHLTRLAETLCYDAEMAFMLGEVFHTLGEYGYLDIRAGNSRDLKREYFKGMYWEGGLLSRSMVTNPKHASARIKNAAVLLSDLEIEDPGELISLLELSAGANFRNLFVIARKISERALNLLTSALVRQKVQVFAVKTPGRTIDEQWSALQDLSILTGGRPLLTAAGDKLGAIKEECLGTATEIYADMEQFGMIEANCPSEQLQGYIACLKNNYNNTEKPAIRKQLRERIGKLQGGSAVLWIGAPTQLAIETRTALAKRASEAVRSAMRYGVVPGGGAAYLHSCKQLKQKVKVAESYEEIAAYKILIQALHEPMRTLLNNAGVPAAEVIKQVEEAGSGHGFDLNKKQTADMMKAGVCDSVSVAKAVVCCAVRAAALALTMQVLVHRRNPPSCSYRP